MAVVSIKNKLRRGNLLVGNDPFMLGDFESIATAAVSSGGTATVSFTSIPQTYKHLQIRSIARDVSTGFTALSLAMSFNSDTGANYTFHQMRGTGSSAAASGATGYTYNYAMNAVGSATGSSIFYANVIDILDYSDTNKNKTVKSLTGYDANGAGQIALVSSLWLNTSAITRIDISTGGYGNIGQYSHFALYGIKG